MKMLCENILEVSGDWRDIKQFYSEHWDSMGFSLKNEGNYENIYVIDLPKGVFKERMECLEYIFLTEKDAPFLWLKAVAKKYKKLDFTLQSKIGEEDEQYIYKSGEAYYLDSCCA